MTCALPLAKGNLDIFKSCCNTTDTQQQQDLIMLSDSEHSLNPPCWGYCTLGETTDYANLQSRREAFYDCYERKTIEMNRTNADSDHIKCFGDWKALDELKRMQTRVEDETENEGPVEPSTQISLGTRFSLIPGLLFIGLLVQLNVWSI